MCGVTGMETQMAEYIKAIFIVNPDTNTYSLAPKYITLAALLPSGHLVHKVLAAIVVEGYV
jgi:hypothetical protein